MRVLRIYHLGRNASHRARDRALVAAGCDVVLVVPTTWPGGGSQTLLESEGFEVVELDVTRPGDPNRHRHADASAVRDVVSRVRPDVVDLHEEPFSAVTRQWLHILDADLPVVTYTAQNVDKRWPPPFAQYETAAFRRLQGIYPCSSQAASVVRGKGFSGAVSILPLAPDPAFVPGDQRHDDPVWTLLHVGRLVPEKSATDSVEALAALRAVRPARLLVIGDGPERQAVQDRVVALGLREHVQIRAWADPAALAEAYAAAHVTLLPSRRTRTWVEQFGRVVTEGHASGAVVVGYATGSITEVAQGAAALVPEGDVASLAGAVMGLATDAQAWSGLRRLGLEISRGRTWAAVAEAQVALYERAAVGPRRNRVRPDRAAAAQQYGPPALVSGGGRPFAVPVLREDTTLSRGLARATDLVLRNR